jgi:DNA-binding NarL/FixJ family response regulator
MAVARVRVFASHPIASAEYRRVLCAWKSCCLVKEEGPFDVGVFDGELPALDAVLALAFMRTPAMRPLLVTTPCDGATCLRWLLRGVWGVVAYDRYEGELGRALETLASGQLWVPASVIMQYLRIEKTHCLLPSASTLTEREEEILGLLMRRLSNKEIASILRITPRTVKFHVGNILHKLQATSRKDLAPDSLKDSVAGLPVLPVPQPVPQSS